MALKPTPKYKSTPVMLLGYDIYSGTVPNKKNLYFTKDAPLKESVDHFSKQFAELPSAIMVQAWELEDDVKKVDECTIVVNGKKYRLVPE